jgi:hypothetical protein
LESAIETYKRIIVESQEAIEYHTVEWEKANDNWNNENE